MIKGLISLVCLQLFWLPLFAQDSSSVNPGDLVTKEVEITGVEKYTRSEKLLVVRSSSQGIFTVESTQDMRGGLLTVVNSESEEVMQMPNLNGNPVALNLASLPKGIYMVRISNEGHLYAAPLVFK